MVSPFDQPPEVFPKHFLVRIGYVIALLVFGMTLFEYFFPSSRDTATPQVIPYGTLAFCGVWVLVFGLLVHYRVPKPSVPPLSPEIKKQHRLYLTGVLILAVIESGLAMITLQKWNSGSEEGILPLMILSMIVAVITMVVLTRYFIFIMDIREKNRKAMAMTVPVIPPEYTITEVPIPVVLPDHLTVFTIFTGLLRHPKQMMTKLPEKSLISASGYFLAMLVLLLVMLIVATIPSASRYPPGYFVGYIIEAYVFMILGWIYIGLITHIMVSIQGVRIYFSQTLRTFFYSSTPLGVIGWIPLFGFLAFLWGAYHIKCGLTEGQNVLNRDAYTAIFFALGGLLVLLLVSSEILLFIKDILPV
jgi:hypothetical protein